MKRVPEVAAMAVLVAGTGLLSLDLWGRAHSGFWAGAGPALHCGLRMERVRRRSRLWLPGWIRGGGLTHRVCPECGWRGLTAGP